MAEIKIYKITCTRAVMMDEQGEGYSLYPWGDDTCSYEGYDDGGENDGGNQMLIQAAPDMYEALSLIYKMHCEDAFRLADKDYIAITKAADALALAEGRTGA